MRDLLLWIHIVAVGAWLGGNFTQMMVRPRLEAAGQATAVAWHSASGQMAKVYYSVAGVVILITGVVLVLDSDVYTFADPFVSIGFLAVIVGAAGGIFYFAPLSRRAVQAFTDGNDAEIANVGQRFTMGAAIDTLIVLGTIFVMVAKLGA